MRWWALGVVAVAVFGCNSDESGLVDAGPAGDVDAGEGGDIAEIVDVGDVADAVDVSEVVDAEAEVVDTACDCEAACAGLVPSVPSGSAPGPDICQSCGFKSPG